MITEFLMHMFGWDTVWYADMQTFRKSLFNLKGGRFHVGTWAGAQNDLVSLKRSKTNAEADTWLSPGGRTILLATLKSILWYLYLDNVVPKDVDWDKIEEMCDKCKRRHRCKSKLERYLKKLCK